MENKLAIASFLVIVVYTVVEHLFKPLRNRLPVAINAWTPYISWLLAGWVIWLAGINLFSEYVTNPIVGHILTAIVCGGGSGLIDLFKPEASFIEIPVVVEAVNEEVISFIPKKSDE